MVRLRFGGVYLEDMEGLKLDVGTLVPEKIHHELQILGLADVAAHHREVVSVQQQLAKKLQEQNRSVGPVSYRPLSARGRRSAAKPLPIGSAT